VPYGTQKHVCRKSDTPPGKAKKFNKEHRVGGDEGKTPYEDVVWERQPGKTAETTTPTNRC